MTNDDRKTGAENLRASSDGSGQFSEGPTRKGGVNLAPTVSRPNIVPGAQNPANIPSPQGPQNNNTVSTATSDSNGPNTRESR